MSELKTQIDQRKMLEADALELYDNVSIYGGKSTFTGQDLIALLDRQAAITEQECLERAAKSDWLGQHLNALMVENRELQAKLEELESGNAVEQQRDHWHSIAVGVYRRFYPHSEYGVPDDPSACTGDPLGMINDAIDAIERERDEWKAKAEKRDDGAERIVFVDGERYERVRECELEYHETGWVSCRECDTSWPNDRPHVYRRCPYCGAKVVKR